MPCLYKWVERIFKMHAGLGHDGRGRGKACLVSTDGMRKWYLFRKSFCFLNPENHFNKIFCAATNIIIRIILNYNTRKYLKSRIISNSITRFGKLLMSKLV